VVSFSMHAEPLISPLPGPDLSRLAQTALGWASCPPSPIHKHKPSNPWLTGLGCCVGAALAARGVKAAAAVRGRSGATGGGQLAAGDMAVLASAARLLACMVQVGGRFLCWG
jgi:hypothetical protein